MNPWELRMSPSVAPDHAEFLEPYPLPSIVMPTDGIGGRIGPAREVRPEPVARPARRVRCYIAGPISKGDLAANVNQATEAFVALATAGIAPFCPHWSVYSKKAIWFPQRDMPGAMVVCEATVAGNGRMSHADWLAVDLAWVDVADCVLRLPGESAGADAEVRHANARGIPVLSTVEQVVAWAAQRFPG